MKTTSEYMVFERCDPPDRRTAVVTVCGKGTKDKLGEIRWFGRWRQYAFFPEPFAVFNKGCMNDIIRAIDELMEERRAPEPPAGMSARTRRLRA